MSWISRAIDWMADKVQESTGEKERRNLVQIIKDLAEDFRTQVTKAVEKLNSQLSQFNQIIKNLNDFRSNHVKSNIEQLHEFLSKAIPHRKVSMIQPDMI